MKSRISVNLCILLYICTSCFSIVWTLYSGAWCPYQTEKIIPCRTRNGSEPYYGPNICWRNDNGSYSCTKKILYRPKYMITYKKILETKYKCCPGRDGLDCENECFNCTSYKTLETRVASVERRLSRLEYPKPSIPTRADRLNRDYLSGPNSIFPQISSKDGIISQQESYASLNSRLQTLMGEFRDFQNRIRLIENEMSRLNLQVDDLTLSNNIAYDYGGVSPSSSFSDKDNQVHRNKDISEDDDITTISIGANFLKSMSPTSTTSSSTPSFPFGGGTNLPNRARHSVKSQSAIRVLEENLERGDIASTLNDDYGDEIYNDNNSTEQYSDQLQFKRENSP